MAFKPSEKMGLPPGSLVYVGDKAPGQLTYQALRLTTKQGERWEICDPESLAQDTSQPPPWLEVRGVHNPEEIERICQAFGVHRLVMEDILNTHQRPKVEFFEDHLFCVVRVLERHPEQGEVWQNVNFVLGKNFLLSFQEEPEDLFAPIQQRLALPGNRIERLGPAYLLYALLDILTDKFYLVIDAMEDEAAALDEAIYLDNGSDELVQIVAFKRRVHLLQKAILPCRELVGQIISRQTGQLLKEVTPYYRDLLDHLAHLTEQLDSLKEEGYNLQSQWMALSGQKANEVMKFLTMMGSIFIPLTFLAGVYGMNFDFMPELRHPWGYPTLLACMALITFFLLGWFRKKKWW